VTFRDEEFMTSQNLQFSRVFRAVLIVSVVASVLSFGVCYCFMFTKLMDKIDTQADLSTQQEMIQEETRVLTEDIYANPPSDLNLLFGIQLALVALLVFWQAHWAAQQAVSPRNALIQGAMVGGGVILFYGVLMLLFSPIPALMQGLFSFVFAGAGMVAGQMAGQNLEKYKAKRTAVQRPTYYGGPPGQLSAAPGAPNPEIYFNMGVSAAMGGRPDEARQHFTRVVQMYPLHLQAWLQLANLAETPEQAWNYVQQARAINPADPAVLDAVNIIWPQVAAKAQHPPTPAPQPDEPPAPTFPDEPPSA
jgi:hypothetical protein